MQLKTCENCGNQYDKTFSVIMNGEEHIFDSFECAINKMAPHCTHCDSLIIGHGAEADGKFYCCAHCAKEDGYFINDRPTQEKFSIDEESRNFYEKR